MICVDSSVAAKWLFDEEYSIAATALLDDAKATRDSIIAPHMLPSEVTNIIRQRTRRGTLAIDAAESLLNRFLAVRISFHNPPTLYHRALTIANTHNLPATYDAHYVALAEMAGATFWTADQRLLRALHGAFSFVRSISD